MCWMDNLEERRWREELANNPPPCYDKWLDRDRSFWQALEEDNVWLKLQEKDDAD